jgi:hypothetical protein
MKTSADHKLRLFSLVIAIILVVLIGGAGVPIVRSILVHNSELHDFSGNLFSMPLPAKSHAIVQHSRIGLLSGHGNHCDYFAAQLVSTSLTEEEISQFYHDKRIPSIGESHLVEIRLHFVKSKTVDEEWFPVSNFNIESAFDVSLEKLTNETVYLIYALDPGYESGSDFRCR